MHEPGPLLTALQGVASGRDVRWARRLIENCVPVDPARLADQAVGLKELASASH